MKKLFTLSAIIFCAYFPFSALSQDTLIYEDFTGYVDTAGTYTVPAGWDISSNGSYTSSFVTSNSGQPAFQFNSSTDRITAPTFSGADTVKFWIKGASTDSLSSLTVLESSDSSNWDTIAFIVPLPTSSTYKEYFVKSTSKHLKFEYEKSAGNLAFDDFLLTGPEPVTASFSAPDACLGDSTCFADLSSTSTGTIISWEWDFGDGATDSVQNPCHQYASAGSYTVQLRVVNSNSDTDAVSKTVNIGAIPVAYFTPADTAGCSPLTVNFTDLSSVSSGTITTYQWYFGNGMTSTTADAATIFSNAGTFNISFIVTSDLGCTDTATGTAIAYASPQIDTSALVITNPNCGLSDGSITGISVSGTSPFSFLWMPGLETSPDLNNAAGGNYTFTVADSNNCTASIGFTLASSGAPSAPTAVSPAAYCDGDVIDSLIAAGTGGTLTWYDDSLLTSVVGTGSPFMPPLNLGDNYFYVTETTTCEGQAAVVIVTVNPASDATINPSGPFCSFDAQVNLIAAEGGGVWSGTGIINAGAGTFDPGIAGAGTHLITYTISGNCGDTDTILVTVNQSADATISPAGPFCENDSAVNLTAADSGGVWSGNGITNSAAGTFNPSVAGSGTHSITYSISGNCGSGDTINIVVNPNPVADFAISFAWCGNINLADSSLGTIALWNWNFGDSTTSMQQNPTHFYSDSLWFQWIPISLTVTDINGCVNSYTDSVMMGCDDIQETVFSRNIQISPNPTKGGIAISFLNENLKSQNINIEVLNILGEIISNIQSSLFKNQCSIDLSNQPEGIYFVTIRNGEEIATKKIVIRK